MVRDETGRETAEHDILRECNEQGVLVRTSLPRSTFVSARRHPAGQAFLVSNTNRLGIYSEAASGYAEVDVSGQLTGHWETPAIPGLKAALGAALTASGELYVGGYRKSDARNGQAVAYRLDRTSRRFVSIDLPVQTGSPTLLGLLGAENDQLIFYGKPVSIVRVAAK